MNSLNTNTEFSLEELKKESVMGVMGTETQREVRIIDLSDFENRKYEIADKTWNEAVEIGFFQ
ncbi:2OG-Fe(II) oxygenase, partial [Acinetobacter ursingii]